MADQQIADIQSDPANANIARDDFVIVSRNGINYKARLNGNMLLPAFDTVNDRGKTLTINSSGNLEWAVAERSQYSLVAQMANPSQNNPSLAIPNYLSRRDYYVVFSSHGGRPRGMYFPPGVPISYTGDSDIWAWMNASNTQMLFDKRDGLVLTAVHVYGRQ